MWMIFKARVGAVGATVALALIALATSGSRTSAQSAPFTVTLAGQSMIRSDIRETSPAAVPMISSLIRGADVVFTNLEVTIGMPGQPNANAPRRGTGFI